nr:unnamed protein product [Digitaria exilis]
MAHSSSSSSTAGRRSLSGERHGGGGMRGERHGGAGLRAAEAVGPRHVGRWRTAATAPDLAPGEGLRWL